MKSKLAITSLTAALSAFPSLPSSFAANPATDTASDVAYNRPADMPSGNSWVTGDNGGTGFTAWTLSASTGGFSIGTSAGNGDGGGGAPPATDIDTPHVAVTDTRAWGITSNDGLAEATRGFTGGALSVGQIFNFSFDNGFVDSNPGFADGDGFGMAGFSLRSGGTTRFEFFYAGSFGAQVYTVSAATGGGPTANFITDEGMTTAFTLTGTDTYSFSVNFLSTGASETFSGSLLNSGGLDTVRLFASNAAPAVGIVTPTADVYYNSMSIVPEPSSVMMFLAGCMLLPRRRRS